MNLILTAVLIAGALSLYSHIVTGSWNTWITVGVNWVKKVTKK